MSRTLPSLVSVVLFLISADVSLARKADQPVPVNMTESPQAKSSMGPSLAPHLPIAAGVLQQWDFDFNGAPDPQGWTSVDKTAQPNYFHVSDEFSVIISGFRSLWCGSSALGGYGNYWKQSFMSVPFNTSGGDITAHFEIRYDTEPNYDNTYFEYSSNDGIWHIAETFNDETFGAATATVNELITSGQYSGPIRFRFRFESDDIFSNEDGNFPSDYGAVSIDNILITEQGVPTPLDSQNFEIALNATSTPDGHWQAYNGTFGNYTALFDGDNVLQEDPVIHNSTNAWGFFSGSTDNYACGGHPEQLVVPFKKNAPAGELFIWNEIQSPTVSLSGVAPTEPVLLSLDAYQDMPLDNLVFYMWHVRALVGGNWGPWRTNNIAHYGVDKKWRTLTVDMRSKIPGSATAIQVALSALDLCDIWCGELGTGACHSQGPLIDNVRVTTSNTLVGTNVQSSPQDPTTGLNSVTFTFDQVTEPGLTSTTSHPTAGANMPYGSNTYYDLSTTATYTGNIQLNLKYVEADLLVPEASLKLLHWDAALHQWVDITTSLNTSTNRITGTTTSLSPFALSNVVPSAAGKLPVEFTLHQNVPNPFNPTTTITYDVPNGGADVTIRIYDVNGRLVRALVDERRPAGTHTVAWDGRDSFGQQVSSGVYFYKMTAGSFTDSRRMVLLK